MDSSSEKRYPEFFKVFLPEHSCSSLRIPDAFLEHVDGKIPETVVLRNRHGSVWRVRVEETEDGAYFREGWPKVVFDNNIKGGEFVVFKYNGYHVFDVKVLRRSGCEDEEADDDDEDDEEHTTEGRGRGKGPAGEKSGESVGSASSARLGGRKKSCNYSVSGYHPDKLEKGIEEFLPSHNPYFVTKLRKQRSNGLTVPFEVRKDFKLRFGESIKLEDPKGKMWRGSVVSWKDGRIWLTDGWKQLCRWNKVTHDDTLICELVPTTGGGTCDVIKVHIIRNASALLRGQAATANS